MTVPVPQDIPKWLSRATHPDTDSSDTLTLARTLRRAMTITTTPRQAAVLVLFGGSPEADPAAPRGGTPGRGGVGTPPAAPQGALSRHQSVDRPAGGQLQANNVGPSSSTGKLQA
ncbi:hypothetical protein [Nocardia brasiliensis]|uniref:hypothetical protein n=1 Tax=Nocardia brasiliensis TaxID=37326 RepID=UPI0024582F1C|nr:hypothetical protein [Nocardia brasiliensis]